MLSLKKITNTYAIITCMLFIQCKDYCENYCIHFYRGYHVVITKKGQGGNTHGNWVEGDSYILSDTTKTRKRLMAFTMKFWKRISIGDTLVKRSNDSVYYLIKSGQPIAGEVLYSNANLKCDCSKYQQNQSK